MTKKEKLNRNHKGDVKIDVGKFDLDKFRAKQYTYVFHYYDDEKQHYFPYFNLFSPTDESFKSAKKDHNLTEVQLYRTPDHPPYDFYICYNNWQLSLLVEHFKEVFEERAFLEGYMPSHKYFRIILPKKIHINILNFINDFQLLAIRDLILEVISIAQHNYTERIAFWERPENQKIVSTAEKESKKAIRLIEKLDNKAWLRGDTNAKKPSKLLYVSFAFNDEAIKIEHPWLTKEFVEHFKEHYDDLSFKNWKIDLERYPSRFEQNSRKQEFKYRLAKSFYYLLTKSKFFEISEDTPYPNKLMLCIAKLLKYCLIPVGSFEETNEVKIKLIRNWIKRKDFYPAITYMEVPADKTKLSKYFESDFINLVDDTKRADVLSIAHYLGKRFNLQHLLPELAHICAAIKECNWLIGHQMLSGKSISSGDFPEAIAFGKLIRGVREGTKITSIKFKMEDEVTEYCLSQRLPLYLTEEALKSYSEDHQVEFDTDTVKTKVKRIEESELKVERDNKFNQPNERFMVKLVDAIYNFLLADAPPEEYEFMPSERYYRIIASLLQETWFFYHKRHPEGFIVTKVKQWHELAISNIYFIFFYLSFVYKSNRNVLIIRRNKSS